MTDTELLNALLGMLERGLQMSERHEWFLDGKKIDINTVHGRFYALQKCGRLESRVTGWELETDLAVESSTFVGEGTTMREAIEDAVRKVAAGATGLSAGTPANPSGAPGVADTPAKTG